MVRSENKRSNFAQAKTKLAANFTAGGIKNMKYMSWGKLNRKLVKPLTKFMRDYNS